MDSRLQQNRPAGRVILRHAPEIMLKASRARTTFSRKLRANIVTALRRQGIEFELQAINGRLHVDVSDVDLACGVLVRVFGLGSVSPVEATSAPRLDAMAETCRAFAERVRGRSFAVRVKRLAEVGFGSVEAERRLGAVLDGPGRVDLRAPEVTVFVELRGDRADFFTERLAGAGGLPGGVEGRALALVSGGFDSAISAWRLMKRGVAVDYLLCNLGGAAYERLVLQVARILVEMWEFGHRPRFHVVDFAPLLVALSRDVRGSYRQVVLKRLMYRAGAAVAGETGAEALITGESLGQVSSQTAANLRAIEPAAGDLPVYRPLIGVDKQEIFAAARHIGTAPLSERVRELCALDGGPPVVRASAERAAAEEARVDLTLLETAVANRKSVDLLSLTARDLRAPYLFVDAIPDDAVVIDCRPPHQFAVWHVPGAVRRDLHDLLDGVRTLDSRRTYVLYCSYGTQTPLLAEAMQQLGYEAYAFRGGIDAVRAHVAAKTAPAEAEVPAE